MKKSKNEQTERNEQPSRKERKRNFAKERLKKRLVTLRRKISKLENRAKRKPKMRMQALQNLVVEYNQTLAVLYGEKGSQVVPNLRLQNRVVEVFVPSIEEGRRSQSAGLRKRTREALPPVVVSKVYTAEDGDVGGLAGFDSPTIMEGVEDDAEFMLMLEDRATNSHEYDIYSITVSDAVKQGEVLFAVYNHNGEVEFALTLKMSQKAFDKKKNPLQFLLGMTQDLFFSGYEVSFYVNEFDMNNGLITPRYFDDDSDRDFFGGGDDDDYDDYPPSSSFSYN